MNVHIEATPGVTIATFYGSYVNTRFRPTGLIKSGTESSLSPSTLYDWTNANGAIAFLIGGYKFDDSSGWVKFWPDYAGHLTQFLQLSVAPKCAFTLYITGDSAEFPDPRVQTLGDVKGPMAAYDSVTVRPADPVEATVVGSDVTILRQN